MDLHLMTFTSVRENVSSSTTLAVAAVMLIGISTVNAYGPYRVTIIPGTSANDLNDYGQVIGYSVVMSRGPRAFVWTPTVANGNTGSMIELAALAAGTGTNEATAINNLGQIAGFSDGGSATHAVLWSAPTSDGSRVLT